MLFPLPKVFSFKETINSRKALWSPTVHVLKEGKIFMLFNHKYIYIWRINIFIYAFTETLFSFSVWVFKKTKTIPPKPWKSKTASFVSRTGCPWCTRNTKALYGFHFVLWQNTLGSWKYLNVWVVGTD